MTVTLKVTIDAWPDGGTIPDEFAFGVPDPETHITLSTNRNPAVAWSNAPEGTRSFALICHDPDVPSKPDGVNEEGAVVPADLAVPGVAQVAPPAATAVAVDGSKAATASQFPFP